MDSLVGTTLSHYRIERELAQGGMATVYLAEDLKHSRRVALKLMKPEVAAAIGPERFLREIRIAARLNHPHVLPLFDSGVAAGRLYYVTPYAAGETLRARLVREPQLPVEEALRLAREIASALAHAHQQGLVHRDVKPENILLADGLALVADFGIARGALESGEGEETRVATVVGAILGSPGYMSPEQATGGDVDARSDLYSLACIVYEMLAGRPPFQASTADRLIRLHVTAEPPPVSQWRETLSQELVEMLAKGLAKEPGDRYPTAARFAEALAFACAAPASASRAAESEKNGGRATPNNLPRERTSFVGRERDLAECARLLGESRLLTLTGIGGCGKTRLALKLGARLLDAYPDGVWFVDFAPLTEREHVAEALATALGLKDVAGRSPVEAVRRQVYGKRLLFVLDNCEHLLDACARIADAILAEESAVRIVATSREGLGLEGERLYALRPLAVPSSESARDPRAAVSAEAVQLWVSRARAVLPAFEVDAGNAEAVVEICRRLDGIPLAIELAAARLRILSVDQIRAKLDDRFRLLAGGSRASLSRHQTLLATIQWSHDQLTSGEQRLFRRLSVFPGGWSLALAARVAGEGLGEFEVLDLLGRLVDKSLVLVEREGSAEPRYRFLETVRQYGQDRLVEAEEADAIRRRQLDEYLALAERAYAGRIEGESRWGPLLEAEHDNLRAALAVARDTDAEAYLELAGALAWFWEARSHLREGREHLTEALAAAAASVPAASDARPARARALWGAARVLAWQGESAAGLAMMSEAVRLWTRIGDAGETAFALEGLGWTQYLGGDDEAALASFQESLALQAEIGDPARVNRARVGLGQILVCRGRVEEARAVAREMLDYAEPRGDRRSEHYAYHYLADCALIEEKFEEAASLYRTSLELAREIGDRLEITFEIQGIAMALAGLGRSERALQLAGAAEVEWERLGADIHVRFWDRLLERHLGGARLALGEAGAARAWEAGRRLSMDEASAAALHEDGGGSSGANAPGSRPAD